MSGSSVSQALRERFDAIRRAEIERLTRKLRDLTDDERRSVDAITADIIHAIARVPERALAKDACQPAAEALVRLFAL
jgi:glutamyl-tRNA reductase